MGKRLWKNVILSLCVLALVFQPVSVFATLEYTGAIGYNCVPYNQAPSDVLNFIAGTYNNLPPAFSVANKNFVIQYDSLGGHLYLYVSNATLSELHLFSQTSNNNSALAFYRIYNGAFQAVTVSCYSYSTPMSSLPSATTRSNLYTTNPNVFWYLVLSPTAVNDASESLFVEASSGGGTGGTDDPSDWPPDSGSYTDVFDKNIYYQLGLFLSSNFNCYTPNGNTHFNSGWVGVGLALTYDYLCKINKSSQNVTVTLADGTSAQLPNYLYSNDSATLSSINDHLSYIHSNTTTGNSYLSTISSRVNTTNTRLNTLNTTINNQMNAVNNKLETAFPSDQAAINDFIAEDLMDDTSGNGLTINRIASSKSDLDDGLNTFKLDTSESQYSNPFSALSDADWSFWSQNTLNNLGSAYSYSFSEASLMSEDDVFTANQNDLLNLLGW